MTYIFFFLALLSTIMWLNTTINDVVSSICFKYSTDKDPKAELTNMLRLFFSFSMAIFWTIYKFY